MRVLLTVLVVCAAAGSAGASTNPSGLWGEVRRGPIVPVCVAEQPCDAPAKGVTLGFVRSGVVVRRATTNDLGRYRVRLPAGTYSVRLSQKPAIGRNLDPVQARVRAGRFVRVDFSIDTGIR
jgi:hypothetical protein